MNITLYNGKILIMPETGVEDKEQQEGLLIKSQVEEHKERPRFAKVVAVDANIPDISVGDRLFYSAGEMQDFKYEGEVYSIIPYGAVILKVG